MNTAIVKTACNSMRKIGGKMLFKVKKASPELLIAGGIVCVIGGTVAACKATKKAEKALDIYDATCSNIRDEAEEKREEIMDNGGSEAELKAVDKAERRQLIGAKMRMAGDVVSAYAVSVGLEAAGIAMFFTSHGIMKHRNGMLLASYNTLDAAYKNYRSRVREELGEEKDREFLLGSNRKEVNYIETDEKGNGRQVKETANVFDRGPGSPYVFDFSPWTTPLYSPNPDYNLLTLRSAESEMCDMLRLQGHLFLNEVLDRLRIDRVPFGQRVGWIYDPSDPDHKGDNFVDFGLCDGYVDAGVADTDTFKKTIRLNFNCDGEIWDLI